MVWDRAYNLSVTQHYKRGRPAIFVEVWVGVVLRVNVDGLLDGRLFGGSDERSL